MTDRSRSPTPRWGSPEGPTARDRLAAERTRLASQRTLLAWARTGLMTMGTGVSFLKLFPDDPAMVLAGEALLALTLVVAVAAAWTHRATRRRLRGLLDPPG